MNASVEHVQHWNGKQTVSFATEIAPQRLTVFCRGRAGGGERQSENRIRAKSALRVGSVQIDRGLIDVRLIIGLESAHGARYLTVDVIDRTTDTLAAERGVTVAKLNSLAYAR